MLKEDLVQKVEEVGGMWKTDTEVDEQIAKISKEKDKKIAIKTQIQMMKLVVINISETNNKDPDLYIRYDGYDSLYIFSYHDFKDGNVKLIPVSEEDFLGKRISQRFEDEAQNHSWWENGRVLQIVEGSDDTNPEFVIEFDSNQN
ncbi:Hypothetical predicted protein [Paramuricea clavata]|uniref:Uncharacterized protein n=1 Tax=Paramuricea clavata TaxID=317549 RepID=A0A7D9K1J4_PARCT|nr:Hypothetical predicted protein [Paramuricea clavata]